MELECKDVVPCHGAGELDTVLGLAGYICGIVRIHVERMDKVEVGAVFNSFEYGDFLTKRDAVPPPCAGSSSPYPEGIPSRCRE